MSSSNVDKMIIWLRQDLRLQDHPSIKYAIENDLKVTFVYILDENEQTDWPMGAASKWWLHHSLKGLKSELAKLKIDLILKKGRPQEVLLELAEASGAKTISWNRSFEPHHLKKDSEISNFLHKKELSVKVFNSALLFEPWNISNKNNQPYQVFTHFWNCCKDKGAPRGVLEYDLAKLKNLPTGIDSLDIEELNLLPKICWDEKIAKFWQPGEKNAQTALDRAIDEVIADYTEKRDYPAINGTSRLSPYLHFGEITPAYIWHKVSISKKLTESQKSAFLRQVGWREFGHHLLYHFPHTTDKPLQEKFAAFPWVKSEANLKAWQQGKTGYPIVDAGMRQLWQTGWMHNRLRMIVGSFLVKDLLISWQEGARWFWDTLVDADLANNTLGWQWVGGCGADAAPYFRIFNPMTQSEKFDKDGKYIKKWVPELSSLPAKWIHKPWEAPLEVLKACNIELGVDYPAPLIDHSTAREEALKAFESVKK